MSGRTSHISLHAGGDRAWTSEDQARHRGKAQLSLLPLQLLKIRRPAPLLTPFQKAPREEQGSAISAPFLSKPLSKQQGLHLYPTKDGQVLLMFKLFYVQDLTNIESFPIIRHFKPKHSPHHGTVWVRPQRPFPSLGCRELRCGQRAVTTCVENPFWAWTWSISRLLLQPSLPPVRRTALGSLFQVAKPHGTK